MDISSIRSDYKKNRLDETDLHSNPLEQFKTWFEQTLTANCIEPNAMHLSTVNEKLQPSGRVVLLKGIDHGFCFFTNYNSRKATEIAYNSKAALTFFWAELERQVRIEGTIEKVTEAESAAYFATRPKMSQLGAVVSAQSNVIESRATLETAMDLLQSEYAQKNILKPSNWGGYRLVPQYLEFWQGRSSRLHDRLVYELDSLGSWHTFRLAP
jgi:pyridoxamine 5'-phosphate oxidase